MMSDLWSALKNKHMMVLLIQIHRVPAAVRAVQAAGPVRIPAAVKPRLYHRCRLMKAIKTAQKRQKVTHGADVELEGLVMKSEQDRLQRYSDCDFLMQGEVFSSPRTARRVHRFGLTLGLAFDLRNGWDLNDQRAKMWSHLQHESPILIFGSWSGHSAGMSHMRWMMDIYRWQLLKDVSLYINILESCFGMQSFAQ